MVSTQVPTLRRSSVPESCQLTRDRQRQDEALDLILPRLIIIPQAFKNVLPALVNEFIVLIKETSIIGYIGMMDLTKGAMLIQSRTYNAFWPLMAAAAIYLVIVGILTWGMNKLERRLRTSER